MGQKKREFPVHCVISIGLLLGTAAAYASAADSSLADAVMHKDKDAVTRLLSDRSSVNTPQKDGTTALHWAVRNNDLATVQALIKAGADVKAVNRYGVTPLSIAGMDGNPNVIAILLNAGVDPNSANAGGETALMTASRTGKIDAVKLLIERGADVNAKDSEHAQTALMWAVIENHIDVINLLLARGADIHARTTVIAPRGEYVPARPGNGSGPGLIRQRALPTPNGGMTPLLFAVRDGNFEVTKMLLDHGADIHCSSGNHTSPIVLALINGQVGLASYLLERGADPNAADDYGRAALFATVDLRNLNQLDADLSTDGKNPLDLMKTLLKKGVNVNAKTDTVPVHGLMQFDASWVNFDGQSTFVRAALSGDVEVMRLLLENGANPNIPTKHGSTALMAAAGMNWVPGQTYSHSEAEYLEAVKLCLEHGGDVNAANAYGLTAMHAAANRGMLSIIQILADHGSQLDAKDKVGRTPMTFAEGIFIAVRPPAAKPQAVALLKRLIAATAATSKLTVDQK